MEPDGWCECGAEPFAVAVACDRSFKALAAARGMCYLSETGFPGSILVYRSSVMKPDVWMNGTFVPWESASVHPLCHSLQRGACLFESLDCNDTVSGRPAVFRLHDHMVRFEKSAEIIGMTLPYDIGTLERAVTSTVARSGLKKCAIRPLAFWSDPMMDLLPGDSPVTVVIGLGEFRPSPPALTAKIACSRKIDSGCMPVKAKVSGNYIASLLAKADAVRGGFKDAIFLDTDGNVAEFTTANIFIVEKGKLLTAPDDSILLGVTRDSIMKIAAHLGIECVQEKFGPDRLKAADEVILSSSGNEVKPIVRVEDSVIGGGVMGPVTARLQSFYGDVITGKVREFEHWLAYA
jgi:branched-chain amino acid aminotransferase